MRANPGGEWVRYGDVQHEIERLQRIEKAWMFVQTVVPDTPLHEALRLTFARDYLERPASEPFGEHEK